MQRHTRCWTSNQTGEAQPGSLSPGRCSTVWSGRLTGAANVCMLVVAVLLLLP